MAQRASIGKNVLASSRKRVTEIIVFSDAFISLRSTSWTCIFYSALLVNSGKYCLGFYFDPPASWRYRDK